MYQKKFALTNISEEIKRSKTMKSKKCYMILLICAAMVLSFVNGAAAKDRATPQDVFDLVLKAVDVLQALGEEGFEAFNDPKGEFVFKDTYVYVMNHETGKLAATPDHPEYIGENITGMQDPNGVYLIRDLLAEAKKPMGGWVEYMWKSDDAKEPTRKVCFAIRIPDTPYTALAGIHNDNVTIKELNDLQK